MLLTHFPPKSRYVPRASCLPRYGAGTGRFYAGRGVGLATHPVLPGPSLLPSQDPGGPDGDGRGVVAQLAVTIDDTRTISTSTTGMEYGYYEY